jgi:hypothetical protein
MKQTSLLALPLPVRGSFLLGCLCVFALSAQAQTMFQLQWQESGVAKKAGGYAPSTLLLSTNAPAGLKAAPAGLKAPLYGSFQLGPVQAPRTFTIIVDQAEGKPARLFVDSTGTGDLSRAPGPKARAKTRKATKLPPSSARRRSRSPLPRGRAVARCSSIRSSQTIQGFAKR